MFCPCCNNFLTESSLIRKNAKYTADGLVAVEYDVRCPDCSEEIGKMSWGRFIAKSDILPSELDNYDSSDGIRIPLIPPPPTKRKKLEQPDTLAETPEEPVTETPADTPDDVNPYADYGNPEAGLDGDLQQTVKYCPHCGLPLPDEY